MPNFLTALPVYNEATTVNSVLDEVAQYSPHVLVVDDGSTDGTGELLSVRRDIAVETHPLNRGYGAALATAFAYADAHAFDFVVTIDCDGQHEPQRIPQLVQACAAQGVDIVSGSRYLEKFEHDSEPPAQRRVINQVITAELNEQLGLELTDAFCGFKAYRIASIRKLQLSEPGYAMPLELWVQAAAHGFRIVEVGVPLIYLDEKRTFGGVLNNGEARLKYYREVVARSVSQVETALPNRSTRCGQGA